MTHPTRIVVSRHMYRDKPYFITKGFWVGSTDCTRWIELPDKTVALIEDCRGYDDSGFRVCSLMLAPYVNHVPTFPRALITAVIISLQRMQESVGG